MSFTTTTTATVNIQFGEGRSMEKYDFQVDIEQDTILQIKQMIQEKLNIPVNEQILIAKQLGFELKNDNNLKYYGFRPTISTTTYYFELKLTNQGQKCRSSLEEEAKVEAENLAAQFFTKEKGEQDAKQEQQKEVVVAHEEDEQGEDDEEEEERRLQAEAEAMERALEEGRRRAEEEEMARLIEEEQALLEAKAAEEEEQQQRLQQELEAAEEEEENRRLEILEEEERRRVAELEHHKMLIEEERRLQTEEQLHSSFPTGNYVQDEEYSEDDDSSSVNGYEFEKPSWTMNNGLRQTKRGQRLSEKGNLALPITFPKGKAQLCQ